jgi:hypothetical protein
MMANSGTLNLSELFKESVRAGELKGVNDVSELLLSAYQNAPTWVAKQGFLLACLLTLAYYEEVEKR